MHNFRETDVRTLYSWQEQKVIIGNHSIQWDETIQNLTSAVTELYESLDKDVISAAFIPDIR